MSVRKALTVLALFVLGTGVSVSRVQATPVTYTFDMSALDPLAGIYSLDFQLTSNEAPTLNTATLTDFTFGGGSALASSFYPPNGGVTGTVATSPLTLTASDFFNSFTGDFTPGSSLSFTLDLTNLAPTGSIPDRFTFGILLDGIEISTTDPSGLNKLLAVDLVGGTAPLQVEQFESSTAVPEPGTLTLLGVGLISSGAALRRAGRASHAKRGGRS